MSEAEIKSIIARNEEHSRLLFAPYNPLTGEGSPVARTKLYMSESEYILLPDYLCATKMFREILSFPNLREYARNKGVDYIALHNHINSVIRVEYDFEFWAATCCTIKDKETALDVKFTLRRPQLKLLKILVDDFFAGVPIRIILLKARQWGGSTLVQMFFAWIQTFRRRNWNSVIIAHQMDPAKNIRAMYSHMAANHPPAVRSVRLKPFEGSTNNKQLVDQGGVISVGTMERPEALRSSDLKLAHFSEVGMYRETKGKKPEEVMTAIIASVPRKAETAVILESTAKGIGNFFHNTWCDAEEGKNAYKPLFVAWFEIEIYREFFRDETEQVEFVRSMTDYEIYLFNLGATLEGIKWYRAKRLEIANDNDMRQEFPSTAEEAFITSGRPAHNPQHTLDMMQYCKEPLVVGELFADAPYGARAIDSSLRFAETAGGMLKIWKMPDRSRKILNRYIVSVDIGGKSKGADWTVISVIDRFWLMNGGVEECIATYRCHLDQDLAIWKAVQLAKFYDNALLVVESNSLNIKEQEGDHSLTILDEIKGIYTNLYYRDDPQKLREGLPVRYGFHTNHATKTDLVTHMSRLLRENGYIERDREAVNEIRHYELKPDGTYGAVKGKHDDIYMSRAIGLKVSSTMPLPYEVKQKERAPNQSERARTASDF